MRLTYRRLQRGHHFLQFPNLKASLPPILMLATIKNQTKKQQQQQYNTVILAAAKRF